MLTCMHALIYDQSLRADPFKTGSARARNSRECIRVTRKSHTISCRASARAARAPQKNAQPYMLSMACCCFLSAIYVYGMLYGIASTYAVLPVCVCVKKSAPAAFDGLHLRFAA